MLEILLVLLLYKLATNYGVGWVLWSCAAIATVISVVLMFSVLWWK